jgi:hypothetical protein
MTTRYEALLERAEQWRDKLNRGLAAQNGVDVFTDYEVIARAFPSAIPHEHTFEFNRIDTEHLKAWGGEAGWDVHPAPEKGSDPAFPSIRFRRRPAAGK